MIIVFVFISLLITFYNIYQHKVFISKINQYTETMDEAQRVQKELEKLMEQAVTISQQLVGNVDVKYQSVEFRPAEGEPANLERTMSDPEADSDIEPNGGDEPKEYEPEAPDHLSLHFMEAGLLRDKGLSAREIARKLNKGQDEIALMLNLYDLSKR